MLELSFYHKPLIAGLLWARMVPDLIFTAGVIVLLVIVFRAMFHLKKADNKAAQEAYERFYEEADQLDGEELAHKN